MAKYQKRSPEEIKNEMDDYNQRVLDLGEHFKRDPETIAEYLSFSANFYQYSIKNQMLIYDQNEHASFVGSYKHFQEQGYQVQKGEKGMKIFVPVKSTFFDRNGKKTPLKDATKKERELIKQGIIETETKLRFKLGTVFDIAQTDCPVQDYPKLCSVGEQSADHAKVYEKLKKYCENLGFPVDETGMRSITLRGAFIPATNEIHLNEKLQDTQKLGTFLHEMAHAFLDHNFDDYQPIHDSMHEFEADGLAIMFLTKFGFGITEPMKAHLSGNYKEFLQALEDLPEDQKEKFSVEKSLKQINDQYKEHIENFEILLENQSCHEFQSNNEYEMEIG